MANSRVHAKGHLRYGPFALFLLLAAPYAGLHAQTYTQTEEITYHDQTTKWVLGQLAQRNVNGAEAYAATFDPATAQPLTHSAFGKLQQTLTYHADGNVATVKDGNHRVTSLNSWYRGVPRNVGYADGTAASAVVDGRGWITSVTDENGFTTGYGYDAMGRLASITPPGGDSVVWNATTQVFEQVAASEYGIPAGHWRQTISTGNARKVIYFDAMWRPLLTREYDAGNVAGTQRFQRFAYDHEGRSTFASYPGTTDALSTGTWTEHDPLGRVSALSQDSEYGLLTTLTEHQDGLQTVVTNPRGVRMRTRYMAFDRPAYDWPIQIEQALERPEYAVTAITRDTFGKPTALTRRNGDGSVSLTRTYAYNAYQELCRTVEPETGATLLGYDAAGNLKWSAAGLPAATACEATGASPAVAARRVDRGYDARNRIAALGFPDGRGNQTWTYESDGAVASITTHNANGGQPVINRYSYNRRRLLTGESVEQPGWYTWAVGYGYNGNGHLAVQTFPTTGLSVNYAPNALGQATQAGSFATGVSYHPNGAIKQFTYGNGIVHTMSQNARQLPATTADGLAQVYEYGYDANGNVDHVYDTTQGSGYSIYSRWMTYDGLDRLTGAGAGVFGGTDNWHRFTYDVLDNLTSWTLAGVKDHHYYYEPTENRLTNINTSTGVGIVGLGYDVQGNLQQRNGQGYQFDYGNRLREVTGKETYRYDGHGRRVLAWSSTGGNILSQYSQGGQLVFQQDQRQGKNIDHIYLAGSLVATREHNYGTGVTAVRYQHTDALGSPVAVTNEAGQVLERTQFEPFGAAIGKTIQGVGYTGHVMDAVTGLTYMQQRYYDPSIGRFLSVDPVTANGKTGGNFNRYWYANDNPYKFNDPDGRFGTDCYGRLCDRYGEKRGGLCERTCISASDRGKERTVDSPKDLPALPDRQYTPGNGWGRSVGEDWERVWRAVPSEQGWINFRTDVARNIPIEVTVNDAGKRGALVGLIISSAVNLLAPDNAIQYRYVSAWGMKYQLGYKHVFNVIENGSVVESRDVYVGHGTIWVNQFEWRTTKQDPVIRTDWEFVW